MIRTEARRAICALLLTSAMIVAGANTPAQAQELPSDLTELSLEQLLNLTTFSVNVLGTHTHLQGEWMIGYRYILMEMDGNRDGTDRKSVSDILQDFPVTPTEMTMQMHMIEVMYAPTDELTLMAMLPYTLLSMDHVTRTGVRFTTASEGVGDFKLGTFYTLYGSVREARQHRLLLDAGLSFPTGSIDEKDNTPAGPDQKLPYPMQVGSGTFDLLPGLTYLGEVENWAWMVEAMGTIRLGENSNDYRWGNRYRLTAWGGRKWTDWLSLSTRIDAHIWGNIHGADPELNPAMVPTADPDRRGGERVDLSFGVNLYVPEGIFTGQPLYNNKGQRLAIQVGFPIYQSLDGPQLETDWLLSVGWNWTLYF